MAFLLPALPMIATIGSLIGTGLSAYSAIKGGQDDAAAANYQAEIAKRNAAIARDNASRAEVTGQVEQLNQDRSAADLEGQQFAAQSASGLSVFGKSQILTRRSAEVLARQDALNIRQGADITAHNYLQQADDQDSAAAFAKTTANSAMISGFINAGSSLIGGLTKFVPAPVYGGPGQVPVPAPRYAS